MCLLLPYFHKGFILWQILQAYITVGRKRNFSECLSFYPSPHSGSHFSLKMLKHFLLFGFTLVLSASWFALAKSHLLERIMRVKELLCETVTSLWDNLGEFRRNLKAICPIGLIKIPLWRNSIAVVLSHTVNVRNKRWVELRSKLGDGPKAKTLSLMVMIQRFVWKMFFQYLPRREYKCMLAGTLLGLLALHPQSLPLWETHTAHTPWTKATRISSAAEGSMITSLLPDLSVTLMECEDVLVCSGQRGFFF